MDVTPDAEAGTLSDGYRVLADQQESSRAFRHFNTVRMQPGAAKNAVGLHQWLKRGTYEAADRQAWQMLAEDRAKQIVKHTANGMEQVSESLPQEGCSLHGTTAGKAAP